jgi:hypothetical protein
MKPRLPRKLKKQIPKWVYCYEPLRVNKDYSITVRPCPLYKRIKTSEKPEHLQDEIDKEYPDEYIGWCKFYDAEIDDQCKICNFNRK